MAKSGADAPVWRSPNSPAPPAPPAAAYPHRPAASTLGAVIVSLALAGTLLWPPRPVLLWNASASSRIGLYAVTSSDYPQVGDMVVAWPPARARQLASTRHYLPASVPLVKRVAAVSGDRVCAKLSTIFVNGRPVAKRRSRDPSGRPMPSWSGCKMLREGDLFLLTPGMPLAFDGRYFGVTRGHQLVGKARLLWAA
jgi:conjugative transfer signal peptidase TraF